MATEGVEVTGQSGDRYDEILTPEALGLVAALQRELGAAARRTARRPGPAPG